MAENDMVTDNICAFLEWSLTSVSANSRYASVLHPVLF